GQRRPGAEARRQPALEVVESVARQDRVGGETGTVVPDIDHELIVPDRGVHPNVSAAWSWRYGVLHAVLDECLDEERRDHPTGDGGGDLERGRQTLAEAGPLGLEIDRGDVELLPAAREAP